MNKRQVKLPCFNDDEFYKYVIGFGNIFTFLKQQYIIIIKSFILSLTESDNNSCHNLI